MGALVFDATAETQATSSPVTTTQAAWLLGGSENGTTTVDGGQLFTASSETVAFILTVIMSVGIGFNCVLLCIVLLHPRVRQLVNAFIAHYAAISMLKCGFCIFFATSLTTNYEPSTCDKIGGSYVVLTSVEIFNLLAMVCAEAYFFGQANVGRDTGGSCCCIGIGLFLIYLGSVILHLGPTIIAGGIGFNEEVGNCVFGFNSIQSYVAHAIWLAITTMGIASVLYYLSIVYREVQTCRPHRIASLVRASVAITTRNQHQVDQATVRRIVADSQRRTVVLMLITSVFVITSYPLFVLTLFDLAIAIPEPVYRTLTYISWTNTLINPVVFLCVDRKLGLVRLLKPCTRGFDSHAYHTTRPTYLDNNDDGEHAGSGGDKKIAKNRTGFKKATVVSNRMPGYEAGETDTDLGCGIGATSKANQGKVGQPPVLKEWQNRVGGRLFLQGEMESTSKDDENDSLMVLDGPGTVTLYDRLNEMPLTGYEQEITTQLPFDQLFSTPSAIVGDLTSPAMAPCVSTSSLTATGSGASLQRRYMMQNSSGGSGTNLAVRQPTVPSGGPSGAGTMFDSTTAPTLSDSLQLTSDNEYGTFPSYDNSRQMQQQQQRLPSQAAMSAYDILTQGTGSLTNIFKSYQQQQQQQQQQQSQRQQQQHACFNMPVVRFNENTGTYHQQLSSRLKSSPLVTSGASFVGTEDSLDELSKYSNVVYNIPSIDRRAKLEDDETRC